MNITLARFEEKDTSGWNDFLVSAKNEIFLFHRSYMSYHADRFADHSLLIYRANKLIALFPANEKEQMVYSHAGLTFGGLVMSTDVRVQDTVAVMQAIIRYYAGLGFTQIIYKAIPSIFHKMPSQEDLYALFRCGATLYRRDVSSVIDLNAPIRFSETKRQAISKCKQAGLVVQESVVFDEYWGLLTQVLSKFGVAPVHSLKEINILRSRFPGNIKLFEARLHGELLAGIVIYDYNDVVHTQYMANAAEGRKLGALDFINSQLISETFARRKYYSFGISTEQEGTVLNEGLMQQKEMMGGRAVVHDFYKIKLT